jgi:small subunit ribosomal protein S1
MNEPTTTDMTMEELLQQEKQMTVGQVVPGTVVKIDDEYVVIDIGYKIEGSVPRKEFQDITGELTVKVGETVDVSVERIDEGERYVRLSKRNVDKSRLWQKLEELLSSGEGLKGRILKRVKGGFRVDIGSIEAFLPVSQVTIERIPEDQLDRFIDQIFLFRIIKVDRERWNVVVSRRAFLELERDENRRKRLSEINPGDVLEGRVKSITSYGAFVDLGGVDGLLHIADLDWTRVQKVEDRVQKDQVVRVQVLLVDREKGKVSLGLKQLTADPWLEVGTRYAPGQVLDVTVVHFADYGVFLRTADNLEGFCHGTELSWSRKWKHPGEVARIGETVQAKVLEVDPSKHKLSLSVKQTQKSPWEQAVDRYPAGTNVTARVKNITDYGAFLELEDGLEGLLHISDVTWDKKVKQPQKALKPGQELTVQVLSVDPLKKRISLGLKQVEGDPWTRAAERYPVGTRAKGTVLRMTDFGAFVELEKNIEGMIHVSEVSKKPPKKIQDALKAGQEVEVSVLGVDLEKRRISLSIRALTEGERREKEEKREEDEFDPTVVEKRTTTWQRMLKKFLKRAKEEDED